MIHFFVGSSVKKPEFGLFPDWIRHRRTGRGEGGEGGDELATAPPNFGQLTFFGQREKIWAKDLNINLKSA